MNRRGFFGRLAGALVAARVTPAEPVDTMNDAIEMRHVDPIETVRSQRRVATLIQERGVVVPVLKTPSRSPDPVLPSVTFYG